jgi:SpoIIAA-like
MPITYRIDPGLRLVEARYSGNIEMHDVQGFISQVVKEPSFGEDIQLLSIFSEMKTTLTSLDFREYKEWRKQFPRFRKIALAAATDYEYGIARMFEMASDSAGSKNIRVFRNVKDAREWLELE